MPAPPSAGAPLDRRRLPPVLRPSAALSLLDITKFYAPTSGGIRSYLHAKAEWVRKTQWVRQAIIVPGASSTVQEDEGVRWYRLRGPRIPHAAPYRALHDAESVRAILEHERPDVIEVGSHFAVPWLVRRANRRLDAPVVWYCHTDLPGLAGDRSRFLASLTRRYLKVLGSSVRLVLAGSGHMAARLRDAGVPRVALAPLGVDLDLWHPGAASRDPGEASPFAVYAGRLAREKHLEVVLEAWPAVERATGCRLVIVGDGTHRDRLQRIPGAAAVTWRPFEADRSRLAALVAGAACCVAPGPHESFGLAAVEALACGTPVLSVDAGAVAGHVRASGAGWTYPVADPVACATSACELLAADRNLLGDRARAWAEAHADGDTAMARLVALEQAVAAG